MNKSLYRIVFNQSRGQLLAVAETAGAQRKSANGQTQGASRSCIGAEPLNTAFGSLALCIGLAMGITLTCVRPAQAKAISNHGATLQAMGNLSIKAQTINNTNAGFTYTVYDVAGAGDTVYNRTNNEGQTMRNNEGQTPINRNNEGQTPIKADSN